MFYSVENRSPYLDKNLLEFSLKIPPHLLIQNGYQKNILRESTKGLLNNKIRLNRQKGFNASISSIFDFDKPENFQYLFNKNSPLAEYVDIKKIKKDFNKTNIPNHISKFVFSIRRKILLER